MRIAILTQPLRYNFGGILQNYALQYVLKRQGHDVVTLDPNRYDYYFWEYPLLVMDHAIGRYLRHDYTGSLIEELRHDYASKIIGRNTYRFINRHISRRAYRDLEFDIKKGEFDAFIVGSDQVWRKDYNDNLFNMFLDFTADWPVKRIAYAASFGNDEWIESKAITDTCRAYLERFDFVSVRESSGISILANDFGVSSSLVADPTILLDRNDYLSVCQYVKKSNKGKCFIHFLDNGPDKNELVTFVTREFFLHPFSINKDVYNRRLKIRDRIQSPVEAFIRAFYDAEFVITDSFHACVFAILFEKPFVCYVNEQRGKTRIESLLKGLHIGQETMISSSKEFVGFSPVYNETSMLIREMREKSLNTLFSVLKN